MFKKLLLMLLLPIVTIAQNQLEVELANQNNDLEIASNNTINFGSSRLELHGKNGSTLQESYLRFDGINLPSDAIINEVYLVFYGSANVTSTTQSVMEISGELGSSLPYSTSTNAVAGLNIKSRNYSTNKVSWHENGTINNQAYQTPNLKDIVTEMFPNGVSNVNFAFKIKGNEEGSFVVRSFSGGTGLRPKLIINYWSLTGSYNSTSTVAYDDAKERSNGGIDLGTAYHNLGGRTDGNISALRFQNVQIPQNSQITDAYIEFYSYGASPAGLIKISAENDNAAIYGTSNKNISSRTYTEQKLDWSVENWSSTLVKFRTPSLKNLIDEVRLNGWNTNENLAFKFEGTATNRPATVYAFEGGVNYRPRLVIEYLNNDLGPSIDGAVSDPALMNKLYINEVSSQGTNTESEDWIELYNDHDYPLLIKGGVFISDKNNNRTLSELNNILILPKGFAILIADGKPEKGANHVDFSLSASGETVYLSRLFNNNVIEQDRLTFGQIPYNQSYGRYPDGSSTLVDFISPSYKASNETGNKLLNIDLSHKRGVYENGFNLTLNAPEGIIIRYTLNGSYPSKTVGTIYTTPINIDKTSVVKFFAYDAQENNSGVVAHSYILKDNYTNENTSGGYNQWLYKANINADEYAQAMAQVPIVSISSGVEFYTTYLPASIEYIDNHIYSERENFFSNSMTKKFGQESIGFYNPNIKFKFNSEAGVKKASYPFFDPYPGDAYGTPEKTHTIELKQGQDNPSRNVYNLGFMRYSEKITQNIQKEMGKYALDTRYVQLFINGKYRGLKTMRNDFKQNNVEEIFGDNDDNYTKVNMQDGYFTNGIVESGDGEQAVWNNIRNLASANNFQEFKKFVNIDDMIKFQIMFMFIDSENEAIAITHNTKPEVLKTIFMINDTDGSFFGANTASTSNVNMTARAFAGGGGNYKYKWQLTSSRNGPGGLFGRFMGSRTNVDAGNLEFKTLVKDVVLKYIGPASGDFTGTEGAPLSVANVQQKMTDNVNELDILYKVDAAYMGFRNNVYDLWKNVDYPRILAQTPERVKFSLERWLEYNMAHTLLEPQILSNEIISEIENIVINNPNINTQLYYTLDGSDPMGNDGVVSAQAFLYTDQFVLPSGNYTIATRAFTTNNWGPKTIKKVEVTAVNTGRFVISGINYKPQLNGDAEFILITNDGNADLDVSGYSISDAFKYTFPVATIIPQGQTVMLAKDLNLIEGYSTLTKYQWTSGNLSNSGEPITFKDNNGNVVDHVYYLSTAPWPVEANGTGYYLQLKATSLNNELAESWKAIPEEHLLPVMSTLALTSVVENEQESEIVIDNQDLVQIIPASDLNVTNLEPQTLDTFDLKYNSEVELKFYPNPIKDQLNIDVDLEGSIEIFNLNGKLISKMNLVEGNNLIQTSSWDTGVYIIRFKNESINKTFKVIKK